MTVVVGLFLGLLFGLGIGLTNGPRTGLFYGLLFGVFFGLLSGGLFSIKHFVLRLFLWQSRSAPLNYIAFLAYAKDLLFLRQVGGGYIFTHRLLRDYFASLAHPGKYVRAESKVTTAAVGS